MEPDYQCMIRSVRREGGEFKERRNRFGSLFSVDFLARNKFKNLSGGWGGGVRCLIHKTTCCVICSFCIVHR